ncbi:MAG: HAMP domain-containing protein [Pirellulales bacterium]|nr:HAMP domain-containing protein [Pirellulales bacterium]
MSYSTLKRALGETGLERKVRWMFGVTLFLLIAGSFLWYRRETDKLIYRGNEIVAPHLVYAVLLEQHFTGLNNMRLSTPSEKRAAEQFVEDIRSEYPWSLISPENDHNLNPPENELESRLLVLWTEKGNEPGFDNDQVVNHFEKEAIFEDPKYHPVGRSVVEDGKQAYRYYQPIFAKSSCLDCHRNATKPRWADLTEGDLIAIIRVEVDQAPIVDAQEDNFGLLMMAAVITAFLSMVALWAIVRYIIVKPLTHLRDVANAVREGAIDQRADINTGDEFQELAAAFNRMVRQLLSQQNELRGVNVALDHKIDELAQANLRLFEMNKLKSDFLSTVSHELRTPLNSILGFSEVLGSSQQLDQKQKRYADNIQRSGKMLLEMIDDILDLAKIESGKMDVRPVDFRAEAIVIELCDLARPLAEKKNIDLNCNMQPGMPPLHQDQAKMQQILNNLLSNAIKFTPEGGRITVSATRDDLGDLRLTVEDTGVGISEEEQTLVFEKFRQGTNVLPGEDVMTREYSGTGLGLSIVKELCRLLGGEVTLESELGKGSIFRVRLPWILSKEPQIDSELIEELDNLSRPLRPSPPQIAAS